MFLERATSNVFGGANAVLESALKNPNQYRDAVLYENLSGLPYNKIKEFIKSPEAKMMLNEGLISQETLERLASDCDTGCLKTTVCHMAKENGDPMWDELVQLRIQERRLFNDLVEKYGDQAKPIADNANKNFVESCIPEYFRR
jgi:hypothetical protein